jgi:hypothetical protein
VRSRAVDRRRGAAWRITRNMVMAGAFALVDGLVYSMQVQCLDRVCFPRRQGRREVDDILSQARWRINFVISSQNTSEGPEANCTSPGQRPCFSLGLTILVDSHGQHLVASSSVACGKIVRTKNEPLGLKPPRNSSRSWHVGIVSCSHVSA